MDAVQNVKHGEVMFPVTLTPRTELGVNSESCLEWEEGSQLGSILQQGHDLQL